MMGSALMFWAIDFWQAFLDRPKIIRWMVRILLGKYAWSELVGLKIQIQRDGYWTDGISYELQKMDYHKDNLKYKDW